MVTLLGHGYAPSLFYDQLLLSRSKGFMGRLERGGMADFLFFFSVHGVMKEFDGKQVI